MSASPRRAPLLALLLLVAAPPGLSGCAARAFERAKAEDSAEAYRRFLSEYPKDELSESAEARLEELEFTEAKRLHNVVAYKRFLEEFPEAAQAPKAAVLLEGLRFNAAADRNTEEGYRQFLRDHPDGPHREEAKVALDALIVERLSQGTEAEQERLAQLRPGDPRAEEIRQGADQKAFAAAIAKGAEGLYAYLEARPDGAHRTEAQARLFERRLLGLVVSGLLDQAEAEAAASPLTPRWPAISTLLSRAKAQAEAVSSQGFLPARAAFYLRPVEDLRSALTASDPKVRWEAAEELGQHVSVRTLDLLQDVLLQSKTPLVRQRAARSLRNVLQALPRPCAEYELATRLRDARAKGDGPETALLQAVLLEAGGDLQSAATAFQRAHDPNAPDPVLLSLWTRIRQERGQHFSAAVTARQLSLWAKSTASALPPEEMRRQPLPTARALCGADLAAREAEAAIAAAKEKAKEFPEDLAAFLAQAKEASRLTAARLEEAELQLAASSPGAKKCADDELSRRLLDSERERERALVAARKLQPKAADALYEVARDSDPSPSLRRLAASLLSP